MRIPFIARVLRACHLYFPLSKDSQRSRGHKADVKMIYSLHLSTPESGKKIVRHSRNRYCKLQLNPFNHFPNLITTFIEHITLHLNTMYLYPESMTVVARYLLPELDEAACCLHCQGKLHIVNPVAIHRLCGIVLCGDCFSKALIDYHSSPLVGRAPPTCPSCHHSLTEENLNLTLPPLRYTVRDSLSFLTCQRWRQELERLQIQQAQAQNSSQPYGFGQVYEPVLFGGKNSFGEEFSVLADGTAVRACPTPQPIHWEQVRQTMQEMAAQIEINNKRLDEQGQWQQDRDSYWATRGGNFGTAPWQRNNNGWQNQSQTQSQNQNQNQNQNHSQNQNQNQGQRNKGKGKYNRKNQQQNKQQGGNQNQGA